VFPQTDAHNYTDGQQKAPSSRTSHFLTLSHDERLHLVSSAGHGASTASRWSRQPTPANILNRQSRTADKMRSSNMETRRAARNSAQKISIFRNVTHGAGRRKLHEGRHDVSSSPNVIRVIELRTQAGHVARMQKKKNVRRV
jgi:hypothetical protein